VRDGGGQIRFQRGPAAGQERLKLSHEHLNETGKMVDFGTVRTNGSIRAKRLGDSWILIAYPRDESFLLDLSAQRFGRPRRVSATGGKSAVVVPQPRGNWWRLPLNGAREYRWKG